MNSFNYEVDKLNRISSYPILIDSIKVIKLNQFTLNFLSLRKPSPKGGSNRKQLLGKAFLTKHGHKEAQDQAQKYPWDSRCSSSVDGTLKHQHVQMARCKDGPINWKSEFNLDPRYLVGYPIRFSPGPSVSIGSISQDSDFPSQKTLAIWFKNIRWGPHNI